MPKIYLVREDGCGIALGEDGSLLLVTGVHPIYARSEMTNAVARFAYNYHFPEGYTIVDLLDSEDPFNEDPSYAEAFERNQQAPAPVWDEAPPSKEG